MTGKKPGRSGRSRFGLSISMLLLFLTIQLSSDLALAWNQNVDDFDPSREIRWPTLPVPYKINSSTAEGNVSVGPISAGLAVRAAFQTWEDVSTSRMAFRDDGGSSLAVANREDEVNLISFVARDFQFSGAVALTPFTYNTQTGDLIQAGVLFNPTAQFTTRGDSGAYDVQSIATHEIGHLIGLDHSAVQASTMLPFACVNSTGLRSLAPDDVAAASTVYPADGFLNSSSVLSGRVLRSGTGAAVFGAHVVATLPSGVVAASTYSVADGSFRIAGLPAGQYSLIAEPLDGPVETIHLASPFFVLNTASLDTTFGTARFQSGSPVLVTAGATLGSLIIQGGNGAPSINLLKLAVVPTGDLPVDPSFCSTSAAIDTAGQDLLVIGTGIDDTTQISVSGGDVSLTLLSSTDRGDGSRALRYSLSIPTSAPAGARSVEASRGGELSMLAGALELVPRSDDVLGPLLTLSYDKNIAAVGRGIVTLTLEADETIVTIPQIAIDRPGTGGDVSNQAMVRGASSRLWSFQYDVAAQNGVTVLDGSCRVIISEARDGNGNDARGLSADLFVIDTTAPGGLLSYSRNGGPVTAGSLEVTATFSEPLVMAPRISIDRPGTGNDVPGQSMEPTANARVFRFDYLILPSNGTSIVDGVTVVTVSGISDAAGNPGQPVANNSFTIDSRSAGISLEVVSDREDAGPGTLPVILRASEPLGAAPLLSVNRPGTANHLNDVAMVDVDSQRVWSKDYIVLPANGTTILDGALRLSVGSLRDQAGNVTTVPVILELQVDTQSPQASLLFSRPKLSIPEGALEVTATFDEPLATTPSMGFNRPGEAHDLPARPMERSGSGEVWKARFDVVAQDGVRILDGAGLVQLVQAQDRAGNLAVLSGGAIVAFDTGPEPPIATFTYSSSEIGRIPTGTLRVTATFRTAPSGAPPVLLHGLPGAPPPTTGPEMSPAGDGRTFFSDLTIARADGLTLFDGVHDLSLRLDGGPMVTVLNDRFISVTRTGETTGHVALELARGVQLFSLPIQPLDGGVPVTAAGLASRLGASSLIRTVADGGTNRMVFRAFMPGGGQPDFELSGNQAYLAVLPRSASLRLSGPPWPAAQRNLTLGSGWSFVALPRGIPAGLTARDLAQGTGSVAVGRPKEQAISGPLSFEAFQEGMSPPFALSLESALLLLHPTGGFIRLPVAE